MLIKHQTLQRYNLPRRFRAAGCRAENFRGLEPVKSCWRTSALSHRLGIKAMIYGSNRHLRSGLVCSLLLKAALNTSAAASSPRFDSQRSRKIFRWKIIDVVEKSWLKGSGQWIENFDRTDLVLPCGLGHLSLKMQNIEFYITVPPGQNVRQNLT